MDFQNTLEFAQQLDKDDPLKSFRQHFYIPQQNGKDKIYFTGNSLGLQPKSAKEYLLKELEQWEKLGGEAHFEGQQPWYSYHEFFPQQLSKIIGCLPHEVVVMDSLTVNLHLLFTSFYRPTKERYKIICEDKAFSSDQYAMESQVLLNGFNPADAIVEVKARAGKYAIRLEDIKRTIREHGDSTALVFFGGVNYYTGQVFHMQAITDEAHAAGAYAGFDLAHAAGNIELNMHSWNVDFACWCTYKYLNSGPGSVGGAYIHQKHAANKQLPRLAGWWGHQKDVRFKLEKGFNPIPTAEGWQLSNAPVFSMAAHKAAIDMFDEAGMKALAGKGKMLSGYLIYLLQNLDSRLPGKNVEFITPKHEDERGCQVSIVVENTGRAMYNYLIDNGVSAGWREPDVIRVAPVPLYNTFEEVWRFVQLIEQKLLSS